MNVLGYARDYFGVRTWISLDDFWILLDMQDIFGYSQIPKIHRLGRSTLARSRRHSTARFRSAKTASSSGSEGNDSSNEPNSFRHMGTGKAFFCKLRIFDHQSSHKASHAWAFSSSLPREAPWSRLEKSKSSLHLDIEDRGLYQERLSFLQK